MKFIVDTNVLLSYPKVLDEGNLVITRRSLKEIDGLKKSPDSELRFDCRRASHAINEKRDEIEFIMKQKMKLCVDDEIIYFAKKYGYGIITNDLNILIVAYKMGIQCRGYNNEGSHYAGVQTFYATFDNLKYSEVVNTIVTTKQPPVPMKENEFLVIKDSDTDEVYCSYRYQNGELNLLGAKRPIANSYTKKILPRNPEQECLFNLLQDTSVKIVMAKGKYGSGKTMCLTNYALEQLEKGKIDKIVWVPNNAFNDNSRELGTLPGSLFEKELPFIGSLIDIVGEIEAERFLSTGLLEIVPISIMRGRNFKNCIILVNEAQNLTEEHIKLLVGRCAEGSRIFFDGDIKQVDSYVFKNKNGLKLLLNLADSEKFSKIFGVVTLDTIERSLVAQASDYLDNI